MKYKVTNQYEFLSRLLFLAYESSSVFGMGKIQARPGMDEKMVFSNIIRSGDYPGRVVQQGTINADYVFGKMMKISIRLHGENVFEFLGGEPRSDYQSWCTRYKTYENLVQVTSSDLGVKVERAS